MHTEMDKTVALFDIFEMHDGCWIEVFNLTGNLNSIVTCIKMGDLADAAYPVEHSLK